MAFSWSHADCGETLCASRQVALTLTARKCRELKVLTTIYKAWAVDSQTTARRSGTKPSS